MPNGQSQTDGSPSPSPPGRLPDHLQTSGSTWICVGPDATANAATLARLRQILQHSAGVSGSIHPRSRHSVAENVGLALLVGRGLIVLNDALDREDGAWDCAQVRELFFGRTQQQQQQQRLTVLLSTTSLWRIPFNVVHRSSTKLLFGAGLSPVDLALLMCCCTDVGVREMVGSLGPHEYLVVEVRSGRPCGTVSTHAPQFFQERRP